ncbi:MAG: hypothetical protein EOO12_11220 [Chitinophagaceae bacterium]|nr:MAG: hypothetical protein EOO12_11220 [Chitinophagaceae bacterium]
MGWVLKGLQYTGIKVLEGFAKFWWVLEGSLPTALETQRLLKALFKTIQNLFQNLFQNPSYSP